MNALSGAMKMPSGTMVLPTLPAISAVSASQYAAEGAWSRTAAATSGTSLAMRGRLPASRAADTCCGLAVSSDALKSAAWTTSRPLRPKVPRSKRSGADTPAVWRAGPASGPESTLMRWVMVAVRPAPSGTDQGRRFSRRVRPSSSQRRPIRAEASPQAPMRREYSSAWTLVPGKSAIVRKRGGNGSAGLEGLGPRALPDGDGFCRTTIPRAAVSEGVPGTCGVRIPLRPPGQVVVVALAWALPVCIRIYRMQG